MTEAFKVVCVIDSFKGSLDSLAAGEAARRGVLHAFPTADVTVIPIADGGEGTLDALMWAHGRDLIEVETTNAAHEPVIARYGIIERDGERLAVLECAQAVGINQVKVSCDLPPIASSHGFGTMLLDALTHDVDEVLVTLGGSATTDGGTGVFQALGARLFDDDDREISINVNPLWHFGRADFSEFRGIGSTKITILGDVKNPLTGPEGAAATFGPQKGATPEQVAYVDERQQRWGRALEQSFGREVDRVPGAGSAGGLGGAFIALGGSMQTGFGRVATELRLADALVDADLVITGEGSIDSQSAYGKVPAGVAELARGAGAIVVGIAGRVQRPLNEMGELLDGAFAVHSELCPIETAMQPGVTAEAIATTSYEIARLVGRSRRETLIEGT